jgi:hypothetical protein
MFLMLLGVLVRTFSFFSFQYHIFSCMKSLDKILLNKFCMTNMQCFGFRGGQAVASLFRRLHIPFQGNESNGKLRLNNLGLVKWFQPKLASPFISLQGDWSSSQSRLGKNISNQQRNIRTGNLSLD